MDDGFIMLNYAKNILNGNGWVFNKGEYYNSCTSVLQVLIYVIQGLFLGVANLEIIAYVNFYIWFFVLAVFIYKFFLSYNKYVAAVISIVVVMIPHFYATFGLETAMNMALLFIALFAYQKQRFRLMYPILSLLILTRLENGLFVSIIFLFLFFKNKESLRNLIKNGILLSLPFISWLIFSYLYFGKIFPESLGAKMWQGSSGGWGIGHIYLKSMASYTVFFVLPWYRLFKVSITSWAMSVFDFFELLRMNICYSIALIVTGFFLIKGFVLSVRVKTVEGMHVLLIWALLHAVLYGLVLNVPGYHWYYSLNIIVTISVFFIGIFALKYKRFCIMPILLILFIIPYIFVFTISSHVTIEDARTIPYRNLSEWINKNTSKNAIIVHEEVGEIAYLTNRRTIDVVGLTSPQYLPLIKKGERGIFWILDLSKYDEVYYVSYHDIYPSFFVKDLFDPMLVYDSKDPILIRLYKIDKSKFVFPYKDQISAFKMNYKLNGPVDRVGLRFVDLRPQGNICSSFSLHAQKSNEDPVSLSISSFDKDENFKSFSFYSVFPLEAIQKGTNGAMIDVTAFYDDGTSQKETFLHKIDSANVLQNNKIFKFNIDSTKLLKKFELRPYDEQNAFDWLHICNPVFSKS